MFLLEPEDSGTVCMTAFSDGIGDLGLAFDPPLVALGTLLPTAGGVR
jgi:hypothetical protein